MHIGEKRHTPLLRHCSFHIFLPTEFLRATSAWHIVPMDASHVRGLADVSESLRSERRLQSNSHSVGGNATFVFPCINIPQCRHFVAYGMRTCSLYMPLHMWIWLHKLQIWGHKFLNHINAQTWKCYMWFSFACYTKKQTN